MNHKRDIWTGGLDFKVDINIKIDRLDVSSKSPGKDYLIKHRGKKTTAIVRKYSSVWRTLEMQSRATTIVCNAITERVRAVMESKIRLNLNPLTYKLKLNFLDTSTHV